MALSHNAFIRGFNSIYQQAPRVRQPADKTDFVAYCLAWVECLATHHHYEETELFPNLDRAAGRVGLTDSAVHEHEAFQGGLERFRSYLEDKGAGFSAAELLAIMDGFKKPLHDHLKAEPPAIVALAKYSTPERPIDILGIATAAGKITPGFYQQCSYTYLASSNAVCLSAQQAKNKSRWASCSTLCPSSSSTWRRSSSRAACGTACSLP
jgi:hemerythrin-like domain-containing protein